MRLSWDDCRCRCEVFTVCNLLVTSAEVSMPGQLKDWSFVSSPLPTPPPGGTRGPPPQLQFARLPVCRPQVIRMGN